MGTSGWSAKASSVHGNSTHPERTTSGREDRTKGKASHIRLKAEPYRVLSKILPNATSVSIRLRSALNRITPKCNASVWYIRADAGRDQHLTDFPLHPVSEAAYHPFLMRLASTINSSGSEAASLFTSATRWTGFS